MLFFNSKPEVTQRGSIVKVDNVRTRTMLRDIKNILNTNRVNLHLFTTLRRNQFTFQAFFALEICMILEELIEDRTILSNVRDLHAIVGAIKEATWLKNLDAPVTARVNTKRLSDITYTLFPYQIDFLTTYDSTTQRFGLNGMLLGTLPGSGKTATTLALAHCLDAQRVIIVCPKIARENVWQANIEKVFKQPQTVWSPDDPMLYTDERFVIVHYEALAKVIALAPALKRLRTVVILDESHNLNEMNALRTQLFLDLCKQLNCRDVLLASGTPIKAIATETLPLFYAIDPLFNDDVAERFKVIYRGGVNSATRILTHRLNQVVFTIDKSELKLGNPIFKNTPVTIPDPEPFTLRAIGAELVRYAKQQIAYYTAHMPEYRRDYAVYVDQATQAVFAAAPGRSALNAARLAANQYDQSIKSIQRYYQQNNLRACPELIVWCNKYEKTVLMPRLASTADRVRFAELKTLVKYMRLKVQGECLGRVLGRKRIEAHLAMVPHIDFDSILRSTLKKTVVFTSFVEVLEKTAQVLRNQQLRPVVVYGKTNNQISNVVQQFGDDPDCNPLIATYASLSTAVPLIMADTMVMVNAPFRNYIFEQAVSRVHRLGADTQTVIHTCFLDTGDEPNISSRSVDILLWSQQQVEQILGIDSTFKIEDANSPLDPDEFAPGFQSLAVEEYALDRLHKPSTLIAPVWSQW